MIGVLLHYGRRIARGIGSDRDQCDLTADAIAEQILYPRYLLVDHWTGAIAVREKKVDQDDLVLEDVGEEAALLSILCDHRKIGEIAVGLLLSCRGRPSFRLGRRAATGRSRAAMVVGRRCERRKRDEKARKQGYSHHDLSPVGNTRGAPCREQLVDAVDDVGGIGNAVKTHPVTAACIPDEDRPGVAGEVGRVGAETGQDPVNLWFFSG